MNDYRKTDNTVSPPYTALRHPVKSQLWCLAILSLGQFFVIKVIFFLEGLFFIKYSKIQSKLSYDV